MNIDAAKKDTSYETNQRKKTVPNSFRLSVMVHFTCIVEFIKQYGRILHDWNVKKFV